MQLRNYQLRALDAIREGWQQFRRQFVLSSTGTGKTILFAHAAKETTARGGHVLVIADTEELIDQAIDKIERVTGIKPGREKAESLATVRDKIVVASVQTLSKSPRLLQWPADHFKLIVIDEADKGIAPSYLKILEHFKDAYVLGVSATADRGDKRAIAEVFENVAFEFNLRDAVNAGWLVRPMVKTVPVQIDMTEVKTTRTRHGTDFDETQVSSRLEPLIDQMTAQLAQEIGERRTLVYVTSIKLARMAAEAATAHGLRAQFVSGECPDRTEKTLAMREGKVQVTFNAQLYIRGFDDDRISCVSVWRPTKIRSLLEQCIGRGMRPLEAIIALLNFAPGPEARRAIILMSSKPDMLILDYLWLTEKLDLIRPTDLVVTNYDIAQHAKKLDQQGDLLDLAEYAGRDYLKTLEEAVRKVANRKARVIDPLEFAVATKDIELETYEPSSRWEMVGVSKPQADLLIKFGIDPNRVSSKGLASLLITKLIARRKAKLCSVAQMKFLDRLGLHDTVSLTHDAAKAAITARLLELKGRKREPQMELEAVELP